MSWLELKILSKLRVLKQKGEISNLNRMMFAEASSCHFLQVYTSVEKVKCLPNSNPTLEFVLTDGAFYFSVSIG